MSNRTSYFNEKLEKILTSEQYEHVVEAIMAGKYSWACTLILRFGGDNPLAYIPYRTYNRLMKENNKGCQPSKHRYRTEEERLER
ncbi:HetP family heterocyst commitment protein [Oscillatoriales cyanobacterium LEGE 11467]|uniref:HetP family heterocyst commitment protein n=1 Tax=Zarconia navalis LEGE 11467 TaxID=1828826 RepID=A0A928VZM9_9CYAN|nr:HetP family heterocyst commitment protein [Zarconia navalis]MBE9041143.1 HetP family heterocyst commitment protein [Zarconia navalis LEGE 11467]